MKRTKKQPKTSKQSKSSSSSVQLCDNCHGRKSNDALISMTVQDGSGNTGTLMLCDVCRTCHFCRHTWDEDDDIYPYDQIHMWIACSGCAEWCIVCKKYIHSPKTVLVAPNQSECIDHPKTCSICKNRCESTALDLMDHYTSTHAVACENCAWSCGCDAVHLTKEWEFGRCWRTTTDVCAFCTKALPDVQDEEEAVATIRQRGREWYHVKCFEKLA